MQPDIASDGAHQHRGRAIIDGCPHDTGEEGIGAPQRIAVYSGRDHLGDGLFKLPFLRSLRANFPSAEIVWVTSGLCVYADTLRETIRPYLDRVVTGTELAYSKFECIVPRKVGLGEIDILIDTQSSIRISIAVKRAIKPRLFISGAANYALSAVKPRQIGLALRAKPPHLVDHLNVLALLAARGFANADRTDLILPDDLLACARSRLPEGPAYVGFAPGAGNPKKRWPLPRFVSLAQQVASRGYTPVFFVGPEERDMLDGIRAAVPSSLFPEENLPQHAPRTPLLVSAFGQRLVAAVANDSGIGHLLSISGIPLVLLFGVHTSAKWAPRIRQLRAIDAQTYGGTSHELIPYETVEDELTGLLNGCRAAPLPRSA